ncbi:MAG: tRNA pseudouridine(38-40) synthase TruA [Dongiaceae bacterium]
MPRYKLILEYDGTPFCGWQRQDNGLSVQQALEEAIEKFSQEKPLITAAGRTDAGVHALGQVVHFDLSKVWDADEIQGALNFHIRPHAISVVAIEQAADDFHARFDAKEKIYRYRIANRRAPLAIDNNRAWHVPVPLDIGAMQEAAKHLLGHHDFSTFRDTRCQAKSPVKTLDELRLEKKGEDIFVTARGRSFLHHQVRIMVGTLTLIGHGKWQADDIIVARDARDRTQGGPTAPAEGLYLVEVRY